MIHLFSGCKELCALPGKACAACGKFCSDIDCKLCSECCEDCGSSLTNFINKPLGLYVILGVVLSGLEIFCCMRALVEKETLSECHFDDDLAQKIGPRIWLYVQLGLAWLNLVFAPYVQYRLWQNLQADADSQSRPGDFAQLSKGQVKQALSNVFWHDIGVCTYVFALMFSVAWSFKGFTWVPESDACDPGGYSTYAAHLGMFFMLFVVTYFIFWNCYLECMSTLEVRAQEYHLPQAAAAVAKFNAEGAGHHHAASAMAGLLGGKPKDQASAVPPPSAPPQSAQQPAKLSAAKRACRASQMMKLMACLLLDAFGAATYAVPAAGEGADVAYAPAQGIAVQMLFGSKSLALLAFMEEILPFTDAIPSATIAWFMEIFGLLDGPAPTPAGPPAPHGRH